MSRATALIRLTVTSDHAGDRLDRFLMAMLPEFSRSHIQRLVKDKCVKVAGQPSKPGFVLKKDQVIDVSVPPPRPSEAGPEDIPLDIIFEDEDMLAINKSAEMVTHPGSGVSGGTLVNALVHHCGALSSVGGVARPGIVHRLDKGTSGILLVAKNDQAHHGLAAQFHDRTVEKTYAAFIWGRPRDLNGIIESKLGRSPTDRKKISSRSTQGRNAVTLYEVEQSWGLISKVLLKPQTGRTHQLRVHMADLGHPVVGDPVYGKGLRRFDALPPELRAWTEARVHQLLHAERISFLHPRTRKPVRLRAPLRSEMLEFQALLNRLLVPQAEGKKRR